MVIGTDQRRSELLARERARFSESTVGSATFHRRATSSLSGGVASSYQVREPWPVYLARGNGARVWDVDGNGLWDFHNAFGSMLQGHAHPAVTRAIAERSPLGTHFAAPTEDAVIVAEELRRRWDLPQWRFTTTGSEATMDAIRIARAYTGRDTVLKVFGGYHGHHDAVMISVPGDHEPGPRDEQASLPHGAGIPAATVKLTVPVPFNDVAAAERRIERLVAEGRPPACFIVEPVVMNMRVIPPNPGYLTQIRELTRRHGIVLVFDEVKTGLCVAAGGATERFGVQPDLVTLAKALGAGLPMGAVGGTAQVMELVGDGRVYQVGTFNGNPLAAAAARASLFEVLTPDAYRQMESLNRRLTEACDAAIAKHAVAAYTVGLGAKGCITFADEMVTDYDSFYAHRDPELSTLMWFYFFNRGLYTTPNRDQEWTLSVAHDERAVDSYAAAFEEFLSELVD